MPLSDELLKKEILLMAGQLARISMDENLVLTDEVENLSHQQLVELKRDLRDLLRTLGGARGS